MLVVIGDRPGALNEVLMLFQEHGVNMTHIQSRPNKGSALNVDIEIDFDGRVEDESVSNLIAAAKNVAQDVLVLDPREGAAACRARS